jgi:hypothetical protein
MAATHSRRLAWRRPIETAIVLALVGVFAALATERFNAYRRLAEVTRMRLDVATMRHALGIALAERSVRGGWTAMRALNGSNPVRLLLHPPAGYRGRFAHFNPAKIAPDAWGFDASRGRLVYRLPRGVTLPDSWPDPPRLVFRIIVSGRPGGGRTRAELTRIHPPLRQPDLRQGRD